MFVIKKVGMFFDVHGAGMVHTFLTLQAARAFVRKEQKRIEIDREQEDAMALETLLNMTIQPGWEE